MSEMIEKVARAIFAVSSVEGVTLPFEKISQGSRDLHLEWAKAAIEAMREPTDDMKNCHEEVHWGYFCGMCGGLTEGWYAMIDEALKETKHGQ